MTSVDFLFKSVQRFDNGQDEARETASACATARIARRALVVSTSGGLHQVIEVHAKQDRRRIGDWIVLVLREIVNRRDDY